MILFKNNRCVLIAKSAKRNLLYCPSAINAKSALKAPARELGGLAVSSEVKKRLRDLLAMVELGEKHERDVARKILNEHLAKHGMSWGDISKPTTERRFFKYKNQFERRLFFQISVAMFGDERDVWKMRGKRQTLALDLTNAELIDFELQYDAYCVGLKKELDVCYLAFLHQHHIFPDRDDAEKAAKLSPEDRTLCEKMAHMAKGMTVINIRKQLEN